MAYPYASDREELLSRLRKVEGQVRGVQRMVESGDACVDVLTQISAVISGMEKVSLRLVREHLDAAVEEASKAKGADGRRTALDEAVRSVERFLQS